MFNFIQFMVEKYGVIGFFISLFIIINVFNGIMIVLRLINSSERAVEKRKIKHGNQYERMTSKEFEKYINEKVYQNVLIPCADGTTEADMVFVNRKGIFCIECKYHDSSYKPVLEGSLSENEWKVTTGMTMSNPFRQNDKHVHAIEREIGNYTIFNMVCSNAPFLFRYFGQEYKSDKTPFLYMKRENKMLMYTWGKDGYVQLKKEMAGMPDTINDSDLARIKEYLSSHEGTEEQRKQHAERLKNMKKN